MNISPLAIHAVPDGERAQYKNGNSSSKTADVAIPPIRQNPGSPHAGRPFAIRLRQLFFCEALPTIGPRGRMIESAAEGVGIAFARRFCELWANNPPSRAGIKQIDTVSEVLRNPLEAVQLLSNLRAVGGAYKFYS